jgi:hypothetical protein
MKSIRKAKAELESLLLIDRNIVSISTELKENKHCIVVGVKDDSLAKTKGIPKEKNGYEVIIRKTGGIVFAST